MKKLSHAEIAANRVALDTIGSKPRLPIHALLENVRSLYNVGSIFRTSDGASVQKLHLVGFTPHPPRPEIDKTALGATLTVPWEYAKDPRTVIQSLKADGVRICALELTDVSKPHFTLQKSDFPLCLAVGNEITGLSREVLDLCEMAIEIPMFGNKQSLNVAVAYGIAVYECVRVLTHDV